jgi:hypothetical protein
MVEELELCLFDTRGTAPKWTVNGPADSFRKILDGGEKIRKEAGGSGEVARRDPGRYAAPGIFINWSHLVMPKTKVSLDVLSFITCSRFCVVSVKAKNERKLRLVF